MMPTAADFRVTLRARMQGAEHASKTTVEIVDAARSTPVGGAMGAATNDSIETGIGVRDVPDHISRRCIEGDQTFGRQFSPP